MNNLITRTARITFVIMLILISGVQSLQAQELLSSKYAATLSAGTDGIGGDFTLMISEHLNTRLGYHGLNYGFGGTIDDSPSVDYDGDLKVSSFSLIVDYFPFEKIVGISAGLLIHSVTLDATAQPIEAYEMDGKEFEADELGALSANLSYSNSLMPYAGFVFSNPVAPGIPVKLHLQIGMVYSQAPQLEMSGTGMISPTADNQVDLQKGLNEFQFLPIVKVGVSYRFGKN